MDSKPTPEEISKVMRDMGRRGGKKGGKKGGKARMAGLTAKQRSRLASEAAKARWDKYREAKKKNEAPVT